MQGASGLIRTTRGTCFVLSKLTADWGLLVTRGGSGVQSGVHKGYLRRLVRTTFTRGDYIPGPGRARLGPLQGYLARKKTPTPLGPPWDPTVGS